MRSVGVAEVVRRGCGDYGDVDVDLAVLQGLPSPTMRTQHAKAAHVAVRTVVAERTVHAAFDVVDGTGLH